MEISRGRAVFRGGFTLTEILIVVAVLAVSSLVLMPALEPTHEYELETYAARVAEIYRFARDEAIRTGQPHAVRHSNANQWYKSFRLETIDPLSLVEDVYHPLTKQLYTLEYAGLPAAKDLGQSISKSFTDSCDKGGLVVFDGRGVPRCADPYGVVLESWTNQITLGNFERTVMVDGDTGRITVQ